MKLNRILGGSGPNQVARGNGDGTVTRGDLFVREDGRVEFIDVETQQTMRGEGDYSGATGYMVLVRVENC